MALMIGVPAAAAATTYAQPLISNFSPASGPVGTIVTVNGSGFSGADASWIDSVHDVGIRVVSDTQVKLTIPADGKTGQLAILNPQHAAFAPQSFTITVPPTYPQQLISHFSPASGAIGSVVTINGSGFTGSNAAWIGSAHDAALKVISDTQAQVTIPADGVTGQIALLNPAHAAFAATAYTITAAVSAAPISAAKLAIRVEGNRLVDASGKTVQLRGVNFSGFEFVPIGGWSPADPSGGQGGQAYGPKWSAITAWKANAVRIALNETSWLGYSCTDTSGVVHNPDPGSNYQSTIKTQVQQAIAAGLYVILDLHWTAPGNACPMLQTQMADADHSQDFWASIAALYKNTPAVMFELYNEPFFNFDFSGDAWAYMMKGSGGSFSGYPATSNSGAWKDVKTSWAVASYQQMINAVRATGATNVVLVGAVSYTQDLSGWLANRPSDPLSQMAATWHAYPTYGAAYGTAAYAQPNFAPQVYSDAQNILAAGIPLVITETGDRNANGTAGAPLVSNVVTWADAHGASVFGWGWDVWGDADNVLIKDVNGTTSDGYGKVFHDWMTGAGPQ
jgi:endoglucanase